MEIERNTVNDESGKKKAHDSGKNRDHERRLWRKIKENEKHNNSNSQERREEKSKKKMIFYLDCNYSAS